MQLHIESKLAASCPILQYHTIQALHLKPKVEGPTARLWVKTFPSEIERPSQMWLRAQRGPT